MGLDVGCLMCLITIEAMVIICVATSISLVYILIIRQSCSFSITDHYKNGCVNVGVFAFSACSIMILCNICALCLCCNTKNKFKENFYSSFTDDEWLYIL